jgi:septal ring factor EnvC (AmiA/AmiB activator)
MKPNQVANTKAYRARQRQKMQELTRQVEELQADNRALAGRVFDLEAQNAALHLRLDRMEDRLKDVEGDRDKLRLALDAALQMSGHQPLILAYNDVVEQLRQAHDLIYRIQRERADRPENHLAQLTADMLSFIRLKCAPDKLNSSNEETRKMATNLVQIVNRVLDLLARNGDTQ